MAGAQSWWYSGRLVLWFLLVYWVIDVASQSDTPLSYSVREEAQSTSLGHLFSDARLFTVYDASVQAQLQWSILKHDKKLDEYFSVTSEGLFQTAKPIDREELCQYAEVCSISLNIQVLPYQYFQIIRVQVEVLDINDNVPMFPVDSAKFLLPESSTPGTILGIPAAEDPDSPKFGVAQYSLSALTDIFELRYSLGVEEEIYLVLKGELDREVMDKYSMEVVATDAGTPQNSAAISVVIEVLDVNDNSPAFDQDTYEIKVTENLEIGSAILTLSATDPDQGANIQYSFSPRTLTNYGDIFNIDQDTGTITSKADIDFESSSSYSLNVIARDESLESLSAQATVLIDVVDLNDNTPHILMNLFNGNSTHLFLEEGKTVGTPVAHLVVTDPDSENGGLFDCFVSNSRFKLDRLSETDFRILTTVVLDREESANYKVIIRCDDRGYPPLSSNKTLVVVVLDINDNSPIFSKSLYRASMLVDSAIGTKVLQVIAQDKDEGLSGTLSYSILPPMDQVFNINITSGDISVKTVSNFDGKAWVNLTVQASDFGLPSRSSFTSIVIDIVHIRDTVPEFAQKMYTFTISENRPARTQVGVVSLQPSLHGLDVTFEFGINSQSTENMFSIDQYSGRLYTARVLDREETDSHNLVVTAGVRGVDQISTTEVTIFIEDVNDNAPRLIFPREGKNTVEISSKIPVGQQIAQIEATDADQAKNKLLTYMILSGNEQGYFAMNRDTGSLYLKEDLLVDNFLFDIGVIVQDDGQPPLSVVGHLKVMVNSSLAGPGTAQSSLLKLDKTTVLILSVVGGLVILIMIVVIVIIRCYKKYSENYKDIEKKMKKLEASNNNADSLSANGANISRDSDADSRPSKDSFAAYDDPQYKFQPVLAGHDSDSGWSSDRANADNLRDSGVSNSIMLSSFQRDRASRGFGALWDSHIPEDELYKEPQHRNSPLCSSQEDNLGFNDRQHPPRPVRPSYLLNHRYGNGDVLNHRRGYPGRPGSSMSYDGGNASISMAPEPYRQYHSDGSRCSTPQQLETAKVYEGRGRRHTNSWQETAASRLSPANQLQKQGSWSSDRQADTGPVTLRDQQRLYQSQGDIQGVHCHRPDPQLPHRLAKSADLLALQDFPDRLAQPGHRLYSHQTQHPTASHPPSNLRTSHPTSNLRTSHSASFDFPEQSGGHMSNSNADQYVYSRERGSSNSVQGNDYTQINRHSGADMYVNGASTIDIERGTSSYYGNQFDSKYSGVVNLAPDDSIDELEVTV